MELVQHLKGIYSLRQLKQVRNRALKSVCEGPGTMMNNRSDITLRVGADYYSRRVKCAAENFV